MPCPYMVDIKDIVELSPPSFMVELRENKQSHWSQSLSSSCHLLLPINSFLIAIYPRKEKKHEPCKEAYDS